MALGFYFGQSGLDVTKYNECIKRLKKAGAAHPAGRSYHSAFGPADKLMIFDVWTSQAAFDKFGKTLMPILEELGAEVLLLPVIGGSLYSLCCLAAMGVLRARRIID